MPRWRVVQQSGLIDFQAGQMQATFSVVIRDDLLLEGDRAALEGARHRPAGDDVAVVPEQARDEVGGGHDGDRDEHGRVRRTAPRALIRDLRRTSASLSSLTDKLDQQGAGAVLGGSKLPELARGYERSITAWNLFWQNILEAHAPRA